MRAWITPRDQSMIYDQSMTYADIELFFTFGDPFNLPENWRIKRIDIESRKYELTIDGQTFWKGCPFCTEVYRKGEWVKLLALESSHVRQAVFFLLLNKD